MRRGNMASSGIKAVFAQNLWQQLIYLLMRGSTWGIFSSSVIYSPCSRASMNRIPFPVMQ